MNDQTAIELINRSLSEPLNAQEKADLQLHLANSPNAQQYLNLSEQIQKSLDSQASQLEPAGPGLSEIARSRIARRLTTELSASQADPSERRRVAEDRPDYQIGPEDQNLSDPSGT